MQSNNRCDLYLEILIALVDEIAISATKETDLFVNELVKKTKRRAKLSEPRALSSGSGK